MKSWLVISALISTALAVELSVRSNCPETVWLATQPNSDQGPLPDGVISLAPGASYTYQIPGSGWAGRFWPKIGCDGSGYNCQFGDSVPPCPAGGCHPPADTKVEFNFPPQPPNRDAWYDVSLVDGYSLPMSIVPRGQNQGGCVPTTCSMSVNACPTNDISGVGDLGVYVNGRKVACLSPCKKWNFPPPWGLGNAEVGQPGELLCCPTPPVSPEQCRTGPIETSQYVNLIHSTCPTAYSYAYDDEAGLHNCPGETSFDVTICP